MKLLFTLGKAEQCDGHYYSPGGIYTYQMAADYYLSDFEQGLLVIRSRPVNRPGDGATQLDGPRIAVSPIAPINKKGLLRLPLTLWSIRRKARLADRYIVRLPCPTGYIVALGLLLCGRKYGVEMAGHATETLEEVWARRGKKHPLFVRFLNGFTRWLIRRAVVVGYRSHYLRREYPQGDAGREVIFSGARLHEQYIGAPRTAEQLSATPFHVISIGRLNPEKGHRVLLEAFAAACDMTEVPMRLTMVGEGASRAELIDRAGQLGLADRCAFPGLIAWGEELFATMDDAHLFVLPSLTEGMPRSLIEAMARGMPALGSDCGGIPELLDPADLVPPGQVEPLARRLAELAEDRDRLVRMSRRNFEASKEHWPENLARSRAKFWRRVIEEAR